MLINFTFMQHQLVIDIENVLIKKMDITEETYDIILQKRE